MGHSENFQLRRLNGYSWSIIVALICATFAMQSHTADISLIEFFQALPLIITFVFWCEKSEDLIKNSRVT